MSKLIKLFSLIGTMAVIATTLSACQSTTDVQPDGTYHHWSRHYYHSN